MSSNYVTPTAANLHHRESFTCRCFSTQQDSARAGLELSAAAASGPKLQQWDSQACGRSRLGPGTCAAAGSSPTLLWQHWAEQQPGPPCCPSPAPLLWEAGLPLLWAPLPGRPTRLCLLLHVPLHSSSLPNLGHRARITPLSTGEKLPALLQTQLHAKFSSLIWNKHPTACKRSGQQLLLSLTPVPGSLVHTSTCSLPRGTQQPSSSWPPPGSEPGFWYSSCPPSLPPASSRWHCLVSQGHGQGIPSLHHQCGWALHSHSYLYVNTSPQ